MLTGGLFPSGLFSHAASDYELLDFWTGSSRILHSLTNCVASIPPSSLRTPPPFTQGRLCCPATPPLWWKSVTAQQEPLCPLRGISPVRGDKDDRSKKFPLKGGMSASLTRGLPRRGHSNRRSATPLPPIHGRFHSAPWAEFHLATAKFHPPKADFTLPPHPVPVPSHNPSTARTKGEIPC